MAMTGTSATYDDVNLILKLYDMRREERMRDGAQWFTANFKAVKTLEDFSGSARPAATRTPRTAW